ncbi:hypothetical protein F2P79_013264%2C partial [Xyrichtys novacula]|uniref:Uncharacterized protein n=1 Tax=Xyrichtys novacula TaxID=13765 RepID=A0AAV1F9R8_XYRNO|nr:hypothetical protein F2P79_013264%2C partial [Xyrichtys novacula]
MGETVRKQLAEGLARVSSLDVADKIDSPANLFIKKWLGQPRCLSDVGLFGRNMLQLPLRSISQGYRQEKVRVVLDLRESTDHLVRAAGSQVRTVRKWKAQEKVDKAVIRLKYHEVIGRVKVG